LQPISQAILLESFPPRKRGVAMAAFVMGVVVAPILGPTLGGWLTNNYSWRWIFCINLPIGIAAALVINAFVEDPPYLKRIPGQNIAILLSSLISAIAFIAFIARELTAEQPIVDLCVWKNRNFAVGSSMVPVIGALLYGTIAMLPLFMQNLLGYTAFNAGIAMSPRGIGALIGTLIIGRVSGRISNRILIGAGFLLLTYSSFMFGGINLEISMRNIIVRSVLNGFAISLIFVPLTTSAMGTLAREQIGNATGIFNLMRNLGGSICIASIYHVYRSLGAIESKRAVFAYVKIQSDVSTPAGSNSINAESQGWGEGSGQAGDGRAISTDDLGLTSVEMFSKALLAASWDA
jgi:DHA2 family multidrug resistance protein